MKKRSARAERRVALRAEKKVHEKEALQKRRARRFWIEMIGILVALAVVVALIIMKGPPSKDPAKITEQELWEAIRTMETSFLRFGDELADTLAALPDPRIQEGLRVPFELVRANQSNELRNEITVEKRRQSPFIYERPEYFSYDVIGRTAPPDSAWLAAAAGFSPLSRTLYIDIKRISIDKPLNPLSLTVLHHELVHLNQDNQIRLACSTPEDVDRYFDFYTSKVNGKARAIINHEAAAYALQLELVDILLHGKLRQTVLSRQPVNQQWLAQELGADRNQLPMIRTMSNLAEVYFSAGGFQQGIPRRFLHAVAIIDEQDRYQLYLLDKTGRIENLRPIRAADLK